MIFWLDHRIFGNGHGLGSPYFDARFYWLSGKLYTWIGGFGAQLQSLQWMHPRPGEERVLCGRRFRPFNSRRQFLWLWRGKIFAIPTPIGRVSVSWACNLPDNIDAANAELRKLRSEIGDWWHQKR